MVVVVKMGATITITAVAGKHENEIEEGCYYVGNRIKYYTSINFSIKFPLALL